MTNFKIVSRVLCASVLMLQFTANAGIFEKNYVDNNVQNNTTVLDQSKHTTNIENTYRNTAVQATVQFIMNNQQLQDSEVVARLQALDTQAKAELAEKLLARLTEAENALAKAVEDGKGSKAWLAIEQNMTPISLVSAGTGLIAGIITIPMTYCYNNPRHADCSIYKYNEAAREIYKGRMNRFVAIGLGGFAIAGTAWAAKQYAEYKVEMTDKNVNDLRANVAHTRKWMDVVLKGLQREIIINNNVKVEVK